MLRKKINALVSCCLLIPTVCSAATAVSGPYVRGYGAFTIAPGNMNTVGITKPEYRRGYDLGGQLGYKSGPIRYELQLSYLRNDLKSFNFNNTQQTTVNGSTRAWAGFLNLYYDFEDLNMSLAPYIGAGIGYVQVKNAINSTVPSTVSVERNNFLFGYKGLVGLSYNFSENYSTDIGYQYLRTKHSNQFNEIYQVHSFMLGVTCRFDK